MLKIPDRYLSSNTIIGSGGMGSVHLYHDQNLDRNVAIKHVTQVPSKRDALDEVRALESVRSDFVVQVLDIIPSDQPNEIGIVMEYIGGDDLGRYLESRTRALALPQAFGILHQIASGLCDIHGANVIHRDLKPTNIVLGPDQRLIIVDFGLSRIQEGRAATEAFRGTTYYGAPELRPMEGRGVERILSKAADIYSFGCIAWYVLTGDEYYEERHWPNVTRKLYEARPDLTDPLASMLSDCLSLSPQLRPTATAIEVALRAELLFDKHRALLVADKPYFINSSSRRASLRFDDTTSLDLNYDGKSFFATNVVGDILSNNEPVTNNHRFCGPCVIYKDGARGFAPFDVSQPIVSYVDFLK